MLLGVTSVALACAPPADHPPYSNSDKAADDDVIHNRGDETEPTDTTEPTGATVGTLREWAGPTIWTELERMMAAGSDGAVYVTDNARVFQVIDGVPTILLTPEALEIGDNDRIVGLTADDQSRIHVFIQNWNSNAEDRVFDAQGVAVSQRTVSTNAFIEMPTASTDGNIAYYLTSDGMFRSTGDSDEMFYDKAALGGDAATGCASLALLAGPERIYYMPGCNGSPVLSGATDGSAFGVLADGDMIDDDIDDNGGFVGFEGMANHPKGGLITNMEQALVWVKDDGTWDVLLTAPALGEAESGTFGFHSSPVATDDTNIYLLADNRIWIVEGLLTE